MARALQVGNNTSNELLYVTFNQDHGCFAVGTDQGFRIYNCEPFKETFRRDFTSGGIGMVEMLFRCNILALVGGGRTPRYPPHKVMIWDDHQNRCIGELSFRSEVQAVRLRRDKIFIALANRVYIYNFADLTLVDHIETADNSGGLCAVSPNPSPCVLACPGTVVGSVRVEHYDGRRQSRDIAAHDNQIRCIALNGTGTRLATASDKGTLIRIWDTASGEKLAELRRGTDSAEIHCIAFNNNSTMLVCTSDKGTVHIFKLNEKVAEGAGEHNTGAAASAAAGQAVRPGGASAPSDAVASGSGLDDKATDSSYFGSGGSHGAGRGGSSLLRAFVPTYFNSQWSFAQFRIPEGTRAICAFGHEPNTIIIVGLDGSFFKASYDPDKGGEAIRIQFSQFAGTSGYEMAGTA